MSSDRDIMKRVQSGETRLFTLLVNKYHERLMRFALSKLQIESDAEDVVQEAFLAAYHARQSYSPEFEFSTWIWTIALNLTRKFRKKQTQERTRQVEYVSRANLTIENNAKPEQFLLDREQSAQITVWLDQLPEPQSDAIRLRFFGELSYQEIALAMDCSISGAKRRVKLGLMKLSEIAASQ
ncbi:ECF RNA polymerase sigma-E factor [Thalassoglobus neptunius]|uniref:RNA polymerase sigma factor n=1 Tax=Thalassoglobus neptunius TaxID=1938619 RepID=A0A5C5VSZ9_9PLAN|nr:RNA polymerase sigma factor [Thalassoglobus neptunius]TWT40729.1 ECF RNA polymerase sigma-E factor [Thalassoglobus neptunius]